ncbi:hypothetical protein D3C72_2511640 [compost metagenome]
MSARASRRAVSNKALASASDMSAEAANCFSSSGLSGLSGTATMRTLKPCEDGLAKGPTLPALSAAVSAWTLCA